MDTLRHRYGVPVGYSGHERGIYPSIWAAAMGACMIERHVTLDRTSWGSDQAASLEPQGLRAMIAGVREGEEARGSWEKRVLDSEVPIREKLRRI